MERGAEAGPLRRVPAHRGLCGRSASPQGCVFPPMPCLLGCRPPEDNQVAVSCRKQHNTLALILRKTNIKALPDACRPDLGSVWTPACEMWQPLPSQRHTFVMNEPR